MINIHWQWSRFEHLSAQVLYTLLKARQDVFVLEQTCLFPDMDNLDQESWHLLGWLPDEAGPVFAAYARVLPPGLSGPQPAIGRVLTTETVRGQGIGHILMAEAIRRTHYLYPGQAIVIGAQERLHDFYVQHGFQQASELYIEDGIPHIKMTRIDDDKDTI